jgi:hypothetical protein
LAPALSIHNKLLKCLCKENGHFETAASDTDRRALIDALESDFDAATSLCAYNGVRFDLPFMQNDLHIPTKRITEWVLKTSDILEQLRLSEGAEDETSV